MNSKEKALVSVDNKLVNLNTQLNNTEADLKKLNKQLEQSEQALKGSSWVEFGGKVESVGNKFTTAGEKITGLGKNLSIVSAAATGVIGAAVKTASDFEYAMSEVKAISRASGEEMDRLEKIAREMGKQTSFSAKEAANGLKYMALAGWDTNEMITGLEPILRAAEAGNMQLATASDLVTDSMGALGKEADELSGYLDKISLTQNITNTSMEDLLKAMINVGGQAQTLGIPVSELASHLGIMANNGIKGAVSGNKLNSIITRMTAQTKPAVEAWEMLGVNVFDADGNFRGLTTVLSEARVKLSGMNEETQAMILKQIVGTQNINAFKFLLEGTNGEVQKYTEALENSSGALNEMATTMKDNLQGRIEKMKSSLSESAIIMGEKLMPIVEDIVRWINQLAEKFASLSPEMQDFIARSIVITAIASPILIFLGKIVWSFGELLSVLGKISEFIGKHGGLMSTIVKGFSKIASWGGKLVGVFGKIKGAAVFVGTALAGISAPAWIVIGVIAALIGAGYLLIKNWDKVKEVAINTWETIKNKCSEVKEWVVNKWEELKQKTIEKWEEIKEAVPRKIEEMKTAISQKWEDIKSTIASKTREILENLGIDVDQMKSDLSEAWTSIKDTASESWNLISTEISNAWDSISTDLGTWFNDVKTSFSTGWEDVKTTTSEKWNGIKESVSTSWSGIKDKLGEWTSGIKTDISEAWEWIKTEAIGAKETGIQQLIDGDWEGFKATIREKVDSIKTKISETWEGIKTKTSETWEGIKTDLGTAWDGIKTNLGSWAGEVGTTISTKWGEIKTSTSETWESIKTTCLETWQTLSTTLSEKWQEMKTTVGEKMESIKTNISNAWETTKTNVLEKMNLIKENVSNKWEETKTNASQKVEEIKTNATQKFEETKTSVTNKMQEIKTKISEKWQEAYTTTKTKLDNVRKICSTIWNGVKQDTWKWLTGIVDNVKTWCSNVKTAIKNGLSNVVDIITAPFRRAKDAVVGIMNKINPFKSIDIDIDSPENMPGYNPDFWNPTPALRNNIALSGSFYNERSSRNFQVEQVIRAKNGTGIKKSTDSPTDFNMNALGDVIAQAIQTAIMNSLNVEVTTNLDGKQVAKSIARYVDKEIKVMNKRDLRLGGA